MIDDIKTAPPPHPLAPLENHLNGSAHNASAAVKAIEAFIEAKIAALVADLQPKEEKE